MRQIIVESKFFSKAVQEYLSPEALRKIQNEIMDNPEMGEVIQGCAGVRKIRVENERSASGKRGGCRIIYIVIPGCSLTYFLTIYDKHKKDDLNQDERKQLAVLARELKKQFKAK